MCWCPPRVKSRPNIVKDIFADDADSDGDETGTGDYARIPPQALGILKRLQKISFRKNDSIVLMIMDAATTGRLSVTYYNEYYPSDFFDRIEKWYTELCWYTLKFKDKKPYYALYFPACQDIVNLAFGTQRESGYVESDDKVFAEQFNG